MSENLIYVSDARLSFPNIIEPQKRVDPQTNEERISYNCELLMLPNHPSFQQFMQMVGNMLSSEVKENAAAVMQMIQADRKSRCYGQGEEKVNKKTFKPYDGYAGHLYITVGNKYAPQMIQPNGQPVDPQNTMAYREFARKLYGGCRVNAAIKPWIQRPNAAKKYSWGIRCDLIAIQFLRDDTPFGEGAPDASGMFGAVQTGGDQPSFMPQPAMPAAPFPGVPPFMS